MVVYLHSVEYKTEWIGGEQVPIIWMVGRDEKGRRKIIREDRFKPYLYVKPHDAAFLYEHHAEKIIKMETGYKSLLWNIDLIRIYTKIPAMVKELREFLRKYDGYTWEADILFPLRFMIDTGIKCGVERRDGKYILYDDVQPNLRICVLDIETLTPRSDRKVDPNGQFPIICITLWDSWTKKSALYYWHDVIIPLDKEITDMVGVIQHCPTERQLLKKIQEWISTYDPDILAGYNVQYDLTQIVKRMRYHKLSINNLSPIGHTAERKNEVLIKGREAFDCYKAYRLLHKEELRKYSLDYILEAEDCSVRKIAVWDFVKAWEQNPESVIERNIIDVIGLVELMEKKEMVEFFDEIRRQVGCRFDESMVRSSVVDINLLREAKEMDVVLPTKVVPDQEFETIGGLNYLKAPGIYDKIAYLDLTAQYPSAILENNISPETVIINPDASADCHIINPGVGFLKTPEGIIPRVIRKLSVLRAAKKSDLDQYNYKDPEFKKLYREQEVLKYQINAAYGYTKYKFARLKSDYVMEAVTTEARRVLMLVLDEIKKTHEVIYYDTDSSYTQLTTNDPHFEADKIVDRVNRLSDYEIKIEYLIDRILLLARKNYALRTYAGEVVIKGRRRSDTSEKSAEIQETLFDMVLNYQEDKIVDYLRKEINAIKRGEIDPFLMGVPKRWTKPKEQYKDKLPIHVRAALFSNKYLGTDYIYGDKVRYLHTGSLGSYPHMVEAVGRQRKITAIGIQEITKIPNEIVIDWDRVIEGDIRGKCELILQIIGKAWSDLTHITLDTFFR